MLLSVPANLEACRDLHLLESFLTIESSVLSIHMCQVEFP